MAWCGRSSRKKQRGAINHSSARRHKHVGFKPQQRRRACGLHTFCAWHGDVQAAVEELQRGLESARAAHSAAKERMARVEEDAQTSVEKAVRRSAAMRPCVCACQSQAPHLCLANLNRP